MQSFHSTHHPEGAPASRVYGRALVKPVAATVLPLMIAVTASALQLGVVWPYVLWGLPGALAVASVWVRFRLGNLPAEISLRPGQAAVRSVHDVLTGAERSWEPLLDVRVSPHTLTVMIGWTTYAFESADWPSYDRLTDALTAARHGDDATTTGTPSSTSFSPHG